MPTACDAIPRHLNRADRCQIHALMKSGRSNMAIARWPPQYRGSPTAAAGPDLPARSWAGGRHAGWGDVPDRRDISERPKEAETKERIGDREADTVIGKDNSGTVMTMKSKARNGNFRQHPHRSARPRSSSGNGPDVAPRTATVRHTRQSGIDPRLG